MGKCGPIVLAILATATAGCGIAVSATAPRAPATVLAVTDAQPSQQIQALATQIKGLDSQHQAAFAALIWQNIKNKTQQDLLLRARLWEQHPDLQVRYLADLLHQVQAMSPHRAIEVARSLPPGAMHGGGSALAGNPPDAIPPAFKPAYDALDKRMRALSTDKRKALIGLIWQETKSLTTQEWWNEEKDWKAHPEHHLAFLNHDLTTLEQADSKTVEALLSETPPEVLQAATKAATTTPGQHG